MLVSTNSWWTRAHYLSSSIRRSAAPPTAQRRVQGQCSRLSRAARRLNGICSDVSGHQCKPAASLVRVAEVPTASMAEGNTPKPLRSAELKSSSSFVPVQLPAPVAAVSDIRMEVRRGSTTVVVTWPAALAAECGTWLRELLR